MQNLFGDVQKAFSQAPCCIVNCAGITQDSLLLKMEERDFDQVVLVNLKVSSDFIYHLLLTLLTYLLTYLARFVLFSNYARS